MMAKHRLCETETDVVEESITSESEIDNECMKDQFLKLESPLVVAQANMTEDMILPIAMESRQITCQARVGNEPLFFSGVSYKEK